MKKNGAKNIVINAKSEKFFLSFPIGASYTNIISLRRMRAKRIKKESLSVEKGVLLKEGG